MFTCYIAEYEVRINEYTDLIHDWQCFIIRGRRGSVPGDRSRRENVRNGTGLALDRRSLSGVMRFKSIRESPGLGTGLHGSLAPSTYCDPLYPVATCS